MSRSLIILCTLVALLMLAGCGQKGPLYLPEPDPSETSQDDERDKR